MGFTKEQRIINSITGTTKGEKYAPVNNIAEEFVLPNNSGDHQRSIKRNDPINDYDIVNKAYVDGVIISHSHVLSDGATDVTSSAAELNLIDGYTGTAANLNTLTNDSMADALHRHSELSASDGTPNPALYVDAAGNVGIGTTSPGTGLHISGDGVIGLFRLDRYAASGDNGAALLLRKATGSVTSPSAVLTGDVMGAWASRGYGATTFLGGGVAIKGIAAENYTDTAAGQHLTFSTNPNNTVSSVERMRITESGYVGIGTTSPTNGVLEVVGQVYGSANCSMLSYTDRTPYPENLQIAYEAIDSVEGKDGTINKTALHPILKDKEDGRNLSMTVSVLLEVIKDMKKRIEVLETASV